MNPETEQQLTPAERFYKSHLKRVCAYQKANPEKCRAKCKRYTDRLREQEPDKWEAVLQQKRDYYVNIRKPKLVAAREEAKKAKQAAVAVTA
jgi:hypothetical protein